MQAATLPALREQLVEALARLLVADLEAFPELDAERERTEEQPA